MQVKGYSTIRFERGPGDTTRVIIDSFEASSRRKLSEIPINFHKDQIKALVEDLCQVAGLLHPW